jgi:hypothetical protein
MTVARCQRRESIRLAVHSALRHRFPDLVMQSFEAWGQPGALQIIHDHLDLFIQILEEHPSIDLAGYKAQLRQRLCPGCFEQLPSGFCALRATGQCAMSRCTPVIYETIREQGAVEA